MRISEFIKREGPISFKDTMEFMQQIDVELDRLEQENSALKVVRFYDIRLDELPFVLRKRRKEKGLTLKQLHLHTGISLSFLSDIERGRAHPSLDTINKLVEFYGDPIVIRFADDPFIAELASDLGVTADELVRYAHESVGSESNAT